MPKRNKKQTKGEGDHEGRPPNLTLASFIQFPDLPSSASSSAEKKNSEETQEIAEETAAENQTSESLNQETATESDSCLPAKGFTENCNPVYFIEKTKKGKLPLTCESRAKGKKVTIISNVTGDASALLSELKKRAGCGGVVRDQGTVELQGDRIKFLTQFLNGHHCLKPYKG